MLGNSAIPFYILIVNLYVFLLMVVDQRQMNKKSWRIPNWQFLVLGLAGGGIGGLMGQAFLQHKLEKKRFKFIFQMGALVALLLFISTQDWAR